MSREWKLYFDDMLSFCEKVESYTHGLTREELEVSGLNYDATLWNVQLFGEAAKNIPEEIRLQMPEIPWRELIGMRNRLAHGYLASTMSFCGTLSRWKCRNYNTLCSTYSRHVLNYLSSNLDHQLSQLHWRPFSQHRQNGRQQHSNNNYMISKDTLPLSESAGETLPHAAATAKKQAIMQRYL